MMARIAVAALVSFAILVSILEFSSVACERRVETTKPPMADILRAVPPVQSELDGASTSALGPAVTF